MTTPDFQVAAVRRLLWPDKDAHLKRIAYSASEAADVFGVPVRKVWALLDAGQIRAPRTGRRYFLPGGTILDVLGVKEHPDINDHRDPAVFEVGRIYTRANRAVLFGTSNRVIRSLAESGRLEESEAIGSARYATGTDVLRFLDRVDEPLRKSA